jgi:hypothetical protein
MSKKIIIVAMVIAIMGISVNLFATDTGPAKTMPTSVAVCEVGGVFASGIAGVFMAVYTGGTMTWIVGPAAGATVSAACNAFVDWASNSSVDQQAEGFIGAKVYYRENYYQPNGSTGKVESVNKWANYFRVRDDSDGLLYIIGYGWQAEDGDYIKPYANRK